VKEDRGLTDLLLGLLGTRSIAGHTGEALISVEEHFRGLGLEVKRTNKGSLMAKMKGSGALGARVISCHMDTLGAMVSGIESPGGKLRMRMIGSYTMPSVEGEYCTVETYDGGLITGTIVFDKASVHAWGMEEASRKREVEDMYIRLDRRVSSADEVREAGISVGNYVHFDSRPRLTETGFIKSRHLDDKAGVAAVMQAAAELSSADFRPGGDIHFMVTVYEEVGHGASGMFSGDVEEFLAVDMGVAAPGRESSEYAVTICAADSSGPFSYRMTRRLTRLAKSGGIPFKLDTFPHYGSDAAAALKSGLDARHALIGPGVDSSHAMERTHTEALRATVDLIKAYITEDRMD